jgi:hypothetical protein
MGENELLNIASGFDSQWGHQPSDTVQTFNYSDLVEYLPGDESHDPQSFLAV